jgi:hypothetical protein
VWKPADDYINHSTRFKIRKARREAWVADCGVSKHPAMKHGKEMNIKYDSKGHEQLLSNQYSTIAVRKAMHKHSEP